MSERKAVWIPAAIWGYSDLTLQQKLILCEINSLDQNGECFASNAHFAEFLDISMSQVSRQISKLERYPNGVLKLRTASKARTDVRIKHGLFKSWHDNGQVWGKANYKYEKQHGVHEMYYKNGKEYSWSPQCFQNGQEVDISNCK
jgi:antitoxin component YwqK of YwqJK toxin-antitoxin module